MNMETNEIAEKIISIPVVLNDGSDITSHSVLRDTGYFESPSSITVKILAKALGKKPEYIDSWLNWSDNKRTVAGWYFIRTKSGTFEVGFFPKHDGPDPIEYSEILQACANFIKHEIEDIRTSSQYEVG